MRRVTLMSLALLAPAAAGAQNFGSAVAARDGEILIGQPINEYALGMVHVYRRAADGSWKHTTELTATDGHPLDRFGRSLSMDGNRLLVGSTSIDESRGAAYIFERNASGQWSQVAKLVADGSAAGESYGRKVLLQGDVAYVAAWGGNESRGSIAVFQRQPNGSWTQPGSIGASDLEPRDFFGSAMDVRGGLMVVGAMQKDSARGTAYLFRKDASGAWKEEAKVIGRGLVRNNQFGAEVMIADDNLVLIAAPGADFSTGAVFAFEYEDGKWNEVARLGPLDGARQSRFGTTLTTVGNEIWVGAPGADRNGAIYRLVRGPDGQPTSASKLTNPAAGQGDALGAAVALSGDAAVLGLPGDDFGAGTALIVSRAGGYMKGPKVWAEDKGLEELTGGKKECGTSHKVATFDCNNVDLLAFLPIKSLGGARGVSLNDVWGWTDPSSGREYALVGRIDGTSFVDVTDPGNPKYLGNLPKTEASPASAWRDIKVYKDHAFIVADGAQQHGMQVFDLAHLRGVRTPQTFKPDAWYDKIASAHNIVIDTANGFAFAVGGSSGGETCGGALHMIDIREPKSPKFAGCFADKSTGNQRTGYTHDAQCVSYHGPDASYAGREICFNSSETAIGIADVTDKAAPKAISHASYPNVAYTHQGWLTDDQRFFYVNDEGDEASGKVAGTRTLIWDVSDLDDPVLAGEYVSDNKAIDHNLYVKDNFMYQSNYTSGLRIFDVSDPKNPRPVGFFDTRPVGSDDPTFAGSWSNYPFFKSGTIVVTSISEGLFLLKRADRPLIP